MVPVDPFTHTFMAGIKQGVYIAILAIVTLVIFLYVQLDDIEANWDTYKKNPIYLLAGPMIGKDISQELNSTAMGTVTRRIQESLGPIIVLMGTIPGILKKLFGFVQSMREMINFLRVKIMNFATEMYERLFGFMVSIRILLIRMKEALMRMMGIFASLIYIQTSAIAFGQSFWNSTFGSVLRFFCFDASCQVRLQSGIWRTMNRIRVGDVLEHDGKVLAVHKYNASKTMYRLKGDVVTYDHFVLDQTKQRFVRAKDHPDAVISRSTSPFLYCLETEKGTIHTLDYIYTDWNDQLIGAKPNATAQDRVIQNIVDVIETVWFHGVMNHSPPYSIPKTQEEGVVLRVSFDEGKTFFPVSDLNMMKRWNDTTPMWDDCYGLIETQDGYECITKSGKVWITTWDDATQDYSFAQHNDACHSNPRSLKLWESFITKLNK